MITSRLGIALCICALGLIGCTKEKAQAIRLGAAHFRAEAHQALDTMERVARREIEAPPRTGTEADEEFLENLAALGPDDALDEQILRLAIDPYAVDETEASAGRRAFFDKVRQSYARLEDVYEDLEAAHLFAAQPVSDSVPLVRKLTAQMLAMAKVWSERPPRLLQHRSAVVAAIDAVRADSSLGDGQRRSELLRLKERYRNIQDQESALQRDVVSHCLRAATAGRSLAELAASYEQLELAEIQGLIAAAIDRAAAVAGKDFSSLRGEVDTVFARIESEPAWKQILEDALKEARAEPASPDTP